VIAEIARLRLVPVPLNAPFVAPVTVISEAAKLVGSTLKVSVKMVVVTEPDVPFAVKPEKVTAVPATFTATVLDAGVIAKPTGFPTVTVMFTPLATAIAEIARVRVAPEPLKAPLVAPVTVMSLAARVVGSALKVSVKMVVVTEPDVPFAVKPEKVTAVPATFTATVLDAGVIVNPAGLASATVTFAPLATVIAEIARLRLVPVPLKAPLVAPNTVISLAAKVVGSALKVRVRDVVVTEPELPFAVKPKKVTAVGAAPTYTAVFKDDGLIVKPDGLASATVTFAPSATVIAEISRLRLVPVPLKAPLVAPVTVISLAAKLVGSALKVSVKTVVVTEPDVPFAVKPEKVTVLVPDAGFGQPRNAKAIDARRINAQFFFIFCPKTFFALCLPG